MDTATMNLMEQIDDPANLECAWERVQANRCASGPDGITIDEFPDHFRDLWPNLRQQLLDGTYQPGPVRRKSIPLCFLGHWPMAVSEISASRRYFQGWIGYFHYGLGKTQLKYLDKWVRRRIRACYWNQWYRVRTWVRMLLKLGVRRDEAISHGCSGRGVWVMSSSDALHVAISIDYLNKQGLASLEVMWSKFASQKRTAGCGPACPVV